MVKGQTKSAAPAKSGATSVGPPALMLGLGYVSVLASLPLAFAEGVSAHLLGYLTGALVPILVIGLVRRIDLDRRRSPYYEPRGFLGPALVVLAVLAMVAAFIHVWPIATELAS